MTAVPPPVPPEIVERGAAALNDAEFGPGQFQPQDRHRIAAETVLAAVYGDIVEAARRDALTAAADAIVADQTAAWRTSNEEDLWDQGYESGMGDAYRIVTDLRDATAPPRAPRASVSDQGADR